MAQLSSLSPKLIWQFFPSRSAPSPTPQARSPAQRLDERSGPRRRPWRSNRTPSATSSSKKPATPGWKTARPWCCKPTSTWCPRPARTPSTTSPRIPSIPTSMANGSPPAAPPGYRQRHGHGGLSGRAGRQGIKHGPLRAADHGRRETSATGAFFGLEAGWLEGGSCSTPTQKRMARVYMGAPAVDANIRFPGAGRRRH